MNTVHDRQSLRSTDRGTTPGREGPTLRIVQRAPQTHKGRVFAVAMVMVFLALLGNAVLSSILVTNQKHLDRVSADVATERAEQQRLEVELASLRSPQRIVDEAEKMGMVRADSPTYLGVPGSEDEDDARAGSPENDRYSEDAASVSDDDPEEGTGR
jgi:cell division protein FtsL